MAFEVIFEDKEVKKFFKNFEENLESIKDGKRQFLGLLSAIVYKDVVNHFEKQEGPEGKWTPWSDIYKQHMKAIGKSGNKILQDSGRLRQGFIPTNVRSQSEGISWFNNAKTKSGFPYSWGHNEGSGQLPQREFMWASDDALNDMADQTLDFILQNGR